MANETLSKGYEPADVEERWLAYWRTHQSFTPDAKSSLKSFKKRRSE
jgi:valyl-tRNA synthetase